MTSVRFANAVLSNTGASIALGEHGEVDATWDQVVNNPLSIGLEDDIHRMARRTIDERILESSGDDDQEGFHEAG